MIRLASSTFALVLASSGFACAQTDEEVAARLTPAVHACESAPENGGTLQQALCYKDEVARQDTRLNETWARVMSSLPPSRREALRKRERTWIKQRDEDCKQESAAYINSTAAYMFNVCMAQAAIRRTMWLEKLR